MSVYDSVGIRSAGEERLRMERHEHFYVIPEARCAGCGASIKLAAVNEREQRVLDAARAWSKSGPGLNLKRWTDVEVELVYALDALDAPAERWSVEQSGYKWYVVDNSISDSLNNIAARAYISGDATAEVNAKRIVAMLNAQERKP